MCLLYQDDLWELYNKPQSDSNKAKLEKLLAPYYKEFIEDKRKVPDKFFNNANDLNHILFNSRLTVAWDKKHNMRDYAKKHIDETTINWISDASGKLKPKGIHNDHKLRESYFDNIQKLLKSQNIGSDIIVEEDGEKIGQQFPTDTGPIDILAISKDKSVLLVVELKR